MKKGKSIRPAVGIVVSLIAPSLPLGFAYAQGNTPPGAGARAQADQTTQNGTGGDQLQEVVVTAERRTSDVQHTADSITVEQGAALQQEGRTTTQQMLEDVAGVALSATSSNIQFPTGSDNQGSLYVIRGVAPNQPTSSINPNVPTTAVYVDGVYEGIGGNYDVDRVEVLRGPQGTLYGRSATAGVVSMYTTDPKLNQFGGNASVEAGNYSLQHYSAAVNLPLGQTLAFRVSADDYQHQGYYTGNGTGKIDSVNARVKMLYKPSDAVSLLVGAALQNNRIGEGGPSGLMSYGNYSSVTYPVVLPRLTGDNIFHQYWANLNWNLGPATLTYIPAFRTWYQDADTLAHFSNALTVRAGIFSPLDQFLTQELRLASNPGSKLTWLVGGFYYDNHIEQSTSPHFLQTLGAPAGQEFYAASLSKETKDLGVFTEETYPITPTTRLTGGLRYDYTYVQTDESYTANATAIDDALIYQGSLPLPTLLPAIYNSTFVGGQAGTRRFYDLTYKARIEHDLTPSNMLYGMISTSFAPGDMQVRNNQVNCTLAPCLALEAVGIPASLLTLASPVAAPYAKETLTAYEIGSKNRFLNNTLQVNGDVWYYRYGGYQLSVIPNPLNPSTQAILNVPMRMFGGELEMSWLATPNDRLGLSYGYTDAYFLDRNAIEPVVPPHPFTYFDAQTHLAGVPPQTVNVTYDHTVHLPGGSTLTPHGDARLLSSNENSLISAQTYAAGGEPYVHVGTQVVGDLSLNWASAGGAYSLTGYVRNVADNRYKALVNPLNLAQGANFNVPASLYDPRTYGVIASVHF